jgi:hypothetical protein
MIIILFMYFPLLTQYQPVMRISDMRLSLTKPSMTLATAVSDKKHRICVDTKMLGLTVKIQEYEGGNYIIWLRAGTSDGLLLTHL